MLRDLKEILLAQFTSTMLAYLVYCWSHCKHFSWQKSDIFLPIQSSCAPTDKKSLNYQHKLAFKSHEARVLKKGLYQQFTTLGETKQKSKKKFQTWLPSLKKYLFSITWKKWENKLSRHNICITSDFNQRFTHKHWNSWLTGERSEPKPHAPGLLLWLQCFVTHWRSCHLQWFLVKLSSSTSIHRMNVALL